MTLIPIHNCKLNTHTLIHTPYSDMVCKPGDERVSEDERCQ